MHITKKIIKVNNKVVIGELRNKRDVRYGENLAE